MDQAMVDYIAQARNSGMNNAEIRQALLSASWPAVDVDAALSPAIVPHVPSEASPVIQGQKTPKHHFHLGVALLVVGIIAVGGSAYAARRYYEIRVLGPTVAISDMPNKMAALTSFSYKFDLKLKANSDNKLQTSDGQANLASIVNIFKGLYERPASELAAEGTTPFVVPKELRNIEIGLKAGGSYVATGKGPEISTIIDASVKQQGTKIGIGGELRSLNDAYFFRVIELPQELIPSLGLSRFSGNFITGKWYSLQRATLRDLKLTPAITTSTGNADQKTKLSQLAATSDLFSVTQTSHDATMPDDPYIFEVRPKRSNIEKFYSDLIRVVQDRPPTTTEGDGLKVLLDNLDKARIALWVRSTDHYLEKASLSFDPFTIQGLALSLGLTLEFSDFNTASIKEPSDVIAFDDDLKKQIYYASHAIYLQGTSTNSYSANIAEARRLLGTKQYTESLVFAGRALAVASSSEEKSEAHYRSGLAYYFLKSFDRAEKEYKTSISLNEKFANPHSSLAAVYIEYGKYKDALAEAQKAISIDPGFAWAHNNAGNAYLGLGDNDNAERSYKTAIVLDPRTPEFLYNLSFIYDAKHDIPQEITTLKKVLELDDTNERAYINLSILYNKQADWTSSIQLLEKGSKKIPESILIHDTLAFVYNQSGQLQKYENELKLEIQINHYYSNAYIYLLEYYAVYNKPGDFAKLINDWMQTGKTKAQIKQEVGNAIFKDKKIKEKILSMIDNPASTSSANNPSPPPATEPMVFVLKPAGRELLVQGNQYTITWSAPTSVLAVNIDIMKSHLVFDSITKNIPNAGSYVWTVPVKYSGPDFNIYVSPNPPVSNLPIREGDIFSIIPP